MIYRCSICGSAIDVEVVPGFSLPDFVRCSQVEFPNCAGWAVPLSEQWPVKVGI